MENQFLEMIRTRRSVRAYRTDAVPEELLDAVLEAGTFAPTGGGRQSPVIVAVREKNLREKLARLNASVMGAETDPYYGAPVVVLVLAKAAASTCVEDGSCVLENMMLAAHAVGLSSVWVHREKEMFESEEGKALLREWGLPDTLRGIGAIALGYAKEEPEQAALRKEDYILRK
ncbi:MAG: nitroreductase [Lachnospiraceae bacterium]|nr:nitroreductase [Lachnospiraceae bacterium]